MSERDTAYAAFVAARHRSLVRTTFLLVGDHGHAEDLVQNALVKTYAAWTRLQDPQNAEAYTRRVIVRSVLRWGARRWRGEVPTERLPEQGVSTRDTVDLQRALAALPPGQRAVVVLLPGRPERGADRRAARHLPRHGQEPSLTCPRRPALCGHPHAGRRPP